MEGKKHYSDKDKCNAMKRAWNDIFRITPEENANYNNNHEDNIITLLNNIQDIISPHDTSDLTRLDNSSIFTREINTLDIKYYVSQNC